MAETYITIGRQFGSGGREIGKKVAQALNIPYYDKELLAVAAKESGLSLEFLRSFDEKHSSSFLYSLVMGHQGFVSAPGATVDQMAANAQRDAVRCVAAKGSCVIVGRCADYILRDKPGLLRVFVWADDDARIRRVCRRDGITEKEAEARLRKVDKERAAYYNFHTDRKWSAADSYDLCVNSAYHGTDAAAELILRFVKV